MIDTLLLFSDLPDLFSLCDRSLLNYYSLLRINGANHNAGGPGCFQRKAR